MEALGAGRGRLAWKRRPWGQGGKRSETENRSVHDERADHAALTKTSHHVVA